MKKVFSIVAFIGILLQTFSQVVIVAEFFANRKYIAEHLCENRDKPQMHCNGKCCLKKKLAKEGKEQAPANNQKSEQAVTLFYSDTRIEITHSLVFSTPGHYFVKNESGTSSYEGSIFHPPGA